MSKPSEPPPAYPAQGQQQPHQQQPHQQQPHQQQHGTPFPSQPQQQGGYYPQPQTYPPGPGYPGVQVHVVPGAVFREHAVSTVCPHCSANITTQVTMDTGVLPWLVCGGLFLVGCSLGCCLIPFCIDGLKDAIHTCPQCRKVVGRYKRM